MIMQTEHERSAGVASTGFAEDVHDGLGARPRRLSSRYLYDELGSQLFEQICELPEYYLMRAEGEIITGRAPEIARRFETAVSLIELGSGSSRKTTWLLDAFLAGRRGLRYLPVDLSRTMLLDACARLAAHRPTLELAPIVAEYQAGLREAYDRERGRPKLVAWLGSSIGNFAPGDASRFLETIRDGMASADRLLVGIDLRKDAAVLVPAYDDSRGLTARFNLNLLARINRELGGHFDLDRFGYRAEYDQTAGCVAMFLVSRGLQRVAIDALDIEVELEPGETIHTECSYKYSPEEIDALATCAGFAVEERWYDRRHRFSLNLMAPRHH
jgi:dimethylhistidine N-methyltransferase